MHDAPTTAGQQNTAATQQATAAGLVVPAASGTARVGVALAIPQPWGSQLDRHRAESGDPLAPYIPAHVTLLGPTDVAGDALPAIEAHLERVAAQHRPYPIHLRGTGTFRPVTEVVFVAVARGISECEQLAGAVRSGPLDRRLQYPYHPHVTVAHDIPASALDAVYEQLAGFTARFTVTHFTLYVHGVDGQWRPVRDFPLGGAADGPVRQAAGPDRSPSGPGTDR
ncbi:MAG: 2'-5' RNA ligase family protein [Micromonosporaceae bacterium]|nr:2'-5' RNA ligase family protein [Micromonosporaceae bacterium]